MRDELFTSLKQDNVYVRKAINDLFERNNNFSIEIYFARVITSM